MWGICKTGELVWKGEWGWHHHYVEENFFENPSESRNVTNVHSSLHIHKFYSRVFFKFYTIGLFLSMKMAVKTFKFNFGFACKLFGRIISFCSYGNVMWCSTFFCRIDGSWTGPSNFLFFYLLCFCTVPIRYLWEHQKQTKL